MATIKDYISLQDGFSPTLDKISNSATRLSANMGGLSGATNKVTESMRNMSIMNSVMIGNLGSELITTVARNMQGYVSSLILASDAYAGMQARLGLIPDAQGRLVSLNSAIFASAERARGSYAQMSGLVAKLSQQAADTFTDVSETVQFAENIQKLFTVGGTNTVEQQSALLQLGQALSSGRLQGDEFRSISEAAPMIQQVIADYMGVTRGKLKELSSEGAITADVIKGAILGATDSINKQFEHIPIKFEDAMMSVKNTALFAMQPVYDSISAFINSNEGAQIFEDMKKGAIIFAKGLNFVINNVLWLMKVVQNVYSFITQNTKMVEIGLIGLGLGFLFLATKIGIATIASIGHAVASGFETAAIIALTFAQQGFNAALAMCPLSWIIGLILLSIGAVFLLIDAINYFCGTSIDALGIIVGGFAYFGAFVYNIVASIWNSFVVLAAFLGHVFVDPLGAIQYLFFNIWNGIIDMVQGAVMTITDLIRKIPGMDKVIGQVDFSAAKLSYDNVAWATSADSYKMNTKNLMDSAVAGYNWGANLDVSLPSLDNALGRAMNKDGKAMKDISDNTGGTAGNTKAMKDAMEASEEDLKFLREMAEREAINKYTTAQVNIDLGGFHNYNDGNTDFDGMVRYLTDKVTEAVVNGGEAVHA